ncbi:class I SAM-dependent methyltransferase [Jannaschia sp. M317]|uniref:class I SAM-dependent methyltransferase n=1 Tax=Jannaschia sp. M317 TaxID=2867011 RepID=UPI0021A41F02|nr:methyltransferase domain-containing protein [Jannaschia sp. M317]UWQ17091.1 methyltransferase domain-containing protein [Jannaschia sp. M317]
MSFQLSGKAPETYEQTMVPLWFGRWAKTLLDLVALKPGDRVLDVACGTGVTTRLARQAVGHGGRVTGLDINAGMLRAARDLARDMDIEWLQSDVVDTALPSGTYDVVLSQHGYHYFPDQAAALTEFHRLLTPGGRIALSIWDGHSPYTRALCTALAAHISPDIAQKQRSQRETPAAAALEADLRTAGYRDVAVIRQELSIAVPLATEFVPLHLSSMPIAGAFLGLDPGQQAALIADVSDALSDHVEGNRIVYPDAVNVLTGIK